MRAFIRAVILITHFVLLTWIVYLLSQGGGMLVHEVALHFLGISFLSFLTIRGSSYFEMLFFTKDKLKRKKRK